MEDMILAGDIGGTKTVLALYPADSPEKIVSVHEERFESGKYASLGDVIADFVKDTGGTVVSACFGVAGPVVGDRARITNLPWVIDRREISARFQIENICLLNDLQAMARAVPALGPADYVTLRQGQRIPDGNMAVVAPGTGLGIGLLVAEQEFSGHGEIRYIPVASEGGHMSFAPQDELQRELLAFLQKQNGHVSYEEVCSGSSLYNIYRFFRDTGRYEEPPWLRERLDFCGDPTPVIFTSALAEGGAGTAIRRATVDMFLVILGSVISDIVVSFLPGGGIYLGGGIPPRIMEKLQAQSFLDSTTKKGRFSGLCRDIPLHVITRKDVALMGAAQHCFFNLAPL